MLKSYSGRISLIPALVLTDAFFTDSSFPPCRSPRTDDTNRITPVNEHHGQSSRRARNPQQDKRSSSCESRRSRSNRLNQSANTLEASSNEIPCWVALAAALRGSHSKINTTLIVSIFFRGSNGYSVQAIFEHEDPAVSTSGFQGSHHRIAGALSVAAGQKFQGDPHNDPATDR